MIGVPSTTPVSGVPPEIPSSSFDTAELPGAASPHVLWVRTGTAHVMLENHPDRGHLSTEFPLAAGEGIWLPAGGRYRVTTEPGTVAFPLGTQVAAIPGLSEEPTRFRVPATWQDWLIQHFNLQVTPLGGSGYSKDRIIDLVLGHQTQESRTSYDPVNTGPSVLLAAPTSEGAATVAEELSRNPALDLTVSEWAARARISPRTLRRTFLSDTGLTFEQWRLRLRLNASLTYLAAGESVERVAVRVGFAGRSGFTRAFHHLHGQTPREFARRSRTAQVGSELALRAAAVRQADDLARLTEHTGAAVAPAPDLLFPARTPAHTGDVHVLSWMYRGTGYLDVGDRRYERQRGVATWIPAHVEHTTGIHADSISLPIGTVTTADLHLSEPLQVTFPSTWDNYLMYCAVSSRSMLRPDDFDPTRILNLFSTQLAAQQALSLPMPTDLRARGAATDYLRHLGRTGATATSDLPAELHRIFRDQTGMTFTRWCYAARMRIARDLLAGGATPSAVARRVGYAHLPTFSAAFSRFHGVPPREYRDREVAEP